jgi:hypothetical protein
VPYLGPIGAYFDVYIFIMNPVALLCPVPRSKSFVLAYIPWQSRVFKINPKLFRCFIFLMKPVALLSPVPRTKPFVLPIFDS